MAVHIYAATHDHEYRNKRAAVDSGTTFYRILKIEQINIVCNWIDLCIFMSIVDIGSAQSPSDDRPTSDITYVVPLRRRHVPRNRFQFSFTLTYRVIIWYIKRRSWLLLRGMWYAPAGTYDVVASSRTHRPDSRYGWNESTETIGAKQPAPSILQASKSKGEHQELWKKTDYWWRYRHGDATFLFDECVEFWLWKLIIPVPAGHTTYRPPNEITQYYGSTTINYRSQPSRPYDFRLSTQIHFFSFFFIPEYGLTTGYRHMSSWNVRRTTLRRTGQRRSTPIFAPDTHAMLHASRP